ncbi:ACP S-malonyltransferase [Lentzea albida]|uniref:Malonyl CoA-acyl carrier protein transacylase n=1 Tax=Lentzea albida TaxID=65499 RepID=A0A1H9WR69_9PSEU|nr:acyltransferase domain-containing protein [Lentzea albida]SES36279.1 Malonyl CoA-acyl carrier protein transacylase [Lentzea albida]
MNQRCTDPVFLFAGHGGFLPGGLHEFADDFAGLPAVLERINAASTAAGGPEVAELLTDRTAPTLRSLVEDDPCSLHLAIFATEICLYDFYTRCCGLSPAVLVGHSLGEFAALVASGCLALEDAVRLIIARDEALRGAGLPTGGMLALRTGRHRADELLAGLADGRAALAVVNSPEQVVVSGPAESLRRLTRLAAAAGVETTHLHVSYPFHNALLDEAAARFSSAVDAVTCAAPGIPVHSPVLGRRIVRPEDVREVLTSHLVRPVGFLESLLALGAEGHHTYLECSARSVLMKLVRAAGEDAPVSVSA